MKYLIVLDKKFETIWGTLGPGVYEAEGSDVEPHVFEYTEGAHISVDIPRKEVRSIFAKDAECLKSHIQRNVDIESKLVAIGRELAQERTNHNNEMEIIKRDLAGICSRNGIDLGSTKGMIERIGKFIDDTVSVNIANAMKLNGITETLTQIDEEQGGFEVNPEYPIGSMDTIRAVLMNWNKEIKAHEYTKRNIFSELELLSKIEGVDFVVNPETPVTAIQNIRYNLNYKLNEHKNVMNHLKTFLIGLGYDLAGISDTEIADTLEDVLRDMKPIKEPVKVPADVAQALDFLIARDSPDFVHAIAMYWGYLPAGFEDIFNDKEKESARKISMWRLGHMDLFPELMKYGYVAEKTEREKKIEEIISDFVGMNIHITEKQAGMIYDKFIEVN